MPSVDQLTWNVGIEAADWIVSRLTDRENRVTDIVPSGFGAYARLLHPAERLARGCPPGPLRWREIAAWSGLELTRLSQFHSVALPAHPVDAPPPWRYPQGPRRGTLTPAEAEILIAILCTCTTTPQSCWFCLGAMYGYRPVVVLADGTRRYDLMNPPEGARLVTETPMPEEAYARSVVRISEHRYLLYHGRIETALTGYPGQPLNQTANLWWPEDRAWCVGSDPELLWTYIAGPEELVTRLVTESALEVFRVPEDAPITDIEPWILEQARHVVDEALGGGESVLSTPLGTVDVSVLRDVGAHSTRLQTDWHSVLGFGGARDGRTWLDADKTPNVREEMAAFVASRVVALVDDSS